MVVSYHPSCSATNRLVAGRSPPDALPLISAGIALGVTHTDFDAAREEPPTPGRAALGLEDVVTVRPGGGAAAVKVVTFVPEQDVDSIVEAMSRAGGGSATTSGAATAPRVRLVPRRRGRLSAVGEAGALNVEPEIEWR